MALGDLGNRINFIREHLQLSVKELAIYLDLPEALLVAVEENNEYEVPISLVTAMLQKLGVSTNWLLTGKGAMFVSQPISLNLNNADTFIEEKYFALKEEALEARIRELEENIVIEASIPLQHIRALFVRFLQLPLKENPGLTPFSKLEELTYDSKLLYCQELEKQFKAAREEFLNYFRQLYQNVSLSRQNNNLDTGS